MAAGLNQLLLCNITTITQHRITMWIKTISISDFPGIEQCNVQGVITLLQSVMHIEITPIDIRDWPIQVFDYFNY